VPTVFCILNRERCAALQDEGHAFPVRGPEPKADASVYDTYAKVFGRLILQHDSSLRSWRVQKQITQPGVPILIFSGDGLKILNPGGDSRLSVIPSSAGEFLAELERIPPIKFSLEIIRRLSWRVINQFLG
jgi:hypothetical protein